MILLCFFYVLQVSDDRLSVVQMLTLSTGGSIAENSIYKVVFSLKYSH